MCARLLACPLCSQPGFLTLDALRNGLVSVATRPLACPVCNEVLLGIDKLTIHLFGHTINQTNTNVTQESKILDVETTNNVQILHNIQTIPLQTWNFLKTQNIKIPQIGEGLEKMPSLRQEREIFPAKENKILVNPQIPGENQEQKQGRVIFLQNFSSNQIFPANLEQTESGTRNLSCGFRGTQENVIPQVQENLERQMKTAESNSIQNNASLIQNSRPLIHQNEKSVSNLPVGTIQNSWIQSNSLMVDQGSLIVRESSRNLEGTQVSNLSINENDKKSSFLMKPSGLANSENGVQFPNQENETGLKNSSVKNDVESKKSPNEILPQLKAFRLLASKEKMERCNICGYRFDDRKILILHKQLVHMIAEKDLNVRPEDLLKNYPCHLCTKVFKMRGSLMVHMRVAHTGYNLGKFLYSTIIDLIINISRT